MDYRIRKGKMPSLDIDVMKRLGEALLLNMGRKEGKTLLGKRLTREANEAWFLWGEFLLEVEEFRLAMAQKPIFELRHALRLHKHCRGSSPQDQKEMSVAIIKTLSAMPQFADWKELVIEEERDEVEKVYDDFKDKVGLQTPPVTKVLPPPGLYFDRAINKIVPMFRTNLSTGLPNSVIPDLLENYGHNHLPTPPKPSVLKMLLTQILDFMVIILIIVAIVEVAMGDPDPAYVLTVVIVLNVVIGFSQEYQANKALEALSSLSVPKARVLRDGKTEEVDAHNLVPGDIVILEEGDAVPADLRIAECAQLEIVESILTGESVAVAKTPELIKSKTRRLPLGDCKGNAFMSTLVARGRGKGIVVRTGSDTEIGKISAAITSTPNVQTPIQRKLQRLGQWLVVLSFLLSALVVIIGVAWRRPVLAMVKVGISLAVSVIPEGLVAVVTVTMALGVRRMAQREAIVRKLPSVETLGSVTVICSDKTGTLTEGKMGASMLWTTQNDSYTFTESTSLDPSAGKIIRLSSASSSPTKTQAEEQVSPSFEKAPPHFVLSMMISSLCNNSDVMVIPAAESETGNVEYKPIGDPTEIALLVGAQKGGMSKVWWETPSNLGLKKIGENAFDSDRKVMSVVYSCEPPSSTASPHAFVLAKGAPESVLMKCSGFIPAADSSFPTPLSVLDTATPLNDSAVALISEQSSAMASRGLRVLGLAIRKLPSIPSLSTPAELQKMESELNFVGLIGLIDPPKKGVKESVSTCKRAGINVIMITGDHVATATAIATDLGILEPRNSQRNRAIRGAELDMLSEEQISELRPFPNVFARVSPDNKLKIVQALQKKGNSVAMTGDGVNDAPAIKAADVGVAMGIGGTEITKQAADIVLANDNFTTIVAAVEEGRRVFDNIKKFIVYLLSCNSAEIIIMIIAASINRELPFTTMMILWANIIADVPPALSLGIEPAERNIMDRKPRDPKSAVLDRFAVSTTFVQGLTMSLISLVVYLLNYPSGLAGPSDDGKTIAPSELTLARSTTFAALTTMQLIQGFLSRSVSLSVFQTGILGNKWMFGAVFLSIGLMLLGFYIPGLCRIVAFY
ncbi:hypothetical protein BKA69DRAFT_1086161 [Paraphysoderma sedebokerense]|nr:hypothetical protein BKA69DRAFT_1086161 [Paraphysoderma sedebokerense]